MHRREYLATAAGVFVLSTAGCLGDGDASERPMQLIAFTIESAPKTADVIPSSDARVADIEVLQSLLDTVIEDGQASSNVPDAERQAVESLLDQLEEDGYFEEVSSVYLSHESQHVEVQAELLT